jgi:hypothetical protein
MESQRRAVKSADLDGEIIHALVYQLVLHVHRVLQGRHVDKVEVRGELGPSRLRRSPFRCSGRRLREATLARGDALTGI